MVLLHPCMVIFKMVYCWVYIIYGGIRDGFLLALPQKLNL